MNMYDAVVDPRRRARAVRQAERGEKGVFRKRREGCLAYLHEYPVVSEAQTKSKLLLACKEKAGRAVHIGNRNIACAWCISQNDTEDDSEARTWVYRIQQRQVPEYSA